MRRGPRGEPGSEIKGPNEKRERFPENPLKDPTSGGMGYRAIPDGFVFKDATGDQSGKRGGGRRSERARTPGEGV